MTDQEIDLAWQALGKLEPGERPFSIFEKWPGWLFYLPVAAAWGWYSLRYRSFTLPALANPAIEFGGLCGESKEAIYELVGVEGRRHFAPAVFFTITPEAEHDATAMKSLLREAGLAYPIVMKPDTGRRGTGVRIIRSDQELEEYRSEFPAGARVMLQRYVPHEGEAGIFYVRMPTEAHGRIVSLTLKYFPKVVGDGHSTLRELILRDPRASKIPQTYFPRHAGKLDSVIPLGQSYKLVSVGNHVRGAIFCDGRGFITPAMEAAFDAIAQEIPDFRFGRFDVRFEKLSDLCRGEKFSILEINGAGSESTHIWDRRAKLIDSYRAYFRFIKQAFVIGAHYRRTQKLSSPSPYALLKKYFQEKTLLAMYPNGE